MSKSYVAAKDGAVLGQFYEEGQPVPVTEQQAKYLAPPYGDALKLATAPKPAAKAPAVKGDKD